MTSPAFWIVTVSPTARSRPRALPSITPWQALEAGNYADLIALLRAAGCPEETIRDLIVMRLSREFHAKLMAMEDQRHINMEWWRGYEDEAARMQHILDGQHLRDARSRKADISTWGRTFSCGYYIFRCDSVKAKRRLKRLGSGSE